MRKKLGTRFPASRIKKIMQADEDVGKIAMAVPLLVSKALELFLQDLCDRTYEITLQKGAKTVNSLHLKQCVKTYSAFDFLTDVVNKVPNLGGMEPGGDEKGISRRRKAFLHDGIEENEEPRSTKMAMRSVGVTPRGRGRGRGRTRGRPPTRMIEREMRYAKTEDDVRMSPEHEDVVGETNASEKIPSGSQNNAQVTTEPSDSNSTRDANQDERVGWPLPDIAGNVSMTSTNLVNLTMQIDEDEDYDNED